MTAVPFRTFFSIVAISIVLIGQSAAAERFITVASTTSTRNAGLYDHIVPKFTTQTGIAVRIVAVGTGQAIRLAKAGDADVLFVHHKPSEENFVAGGYGIKRFDVMYNDFVIVGPEADPARVGASKDITSALAGIALWKARFASRGDDSGTHKKEQALWEAAGVDTGAGDTGWYRETGSGMGATLNTASAMNAYTLTDRGTWLKFANKGNLVILAQGDRRLFNPYGIILVNPKKHPHVKARDGQAFINWIISPAGQTAIASYTIKGQQAFFPNVNPAN